MTGPRPDDLGARPDSSREVADRLLAFDARYGRGMAIFALCTTPLFLLVNWTLTLARSSVTGPPPDTLDFVVFWAAARLSLAGSGTDAFDLAALKAVEGPVAVDEMLWLYPPGMMALVTPLGLLPYAPALIVFGVLSLVAWSMVIRRWLVAGRNLRIAFMLAPALMPALLIGQMTLLLASGMLAGLIAISRGRPILAGGFFGLLTLKPQLCLLLPVALLAGGHWRTIASAAATAALVAGLPTLHYGLAYWRAFADSSAGLMDMVATNFYQAWGMLGGYTLLRLAGAGHQAALVGQVIMALAAAVSVWATWRAPAATNDIRTAVVLAAIPLATPYLWNYDFAFATLAGLALLRAGHLATGPRSLLLVLLWLGPMPYAAAVVLQVSNHLPPVPQGPFLMPLVLVTLFLALRAAFALPARSDQETPI